MKKRFKILFFLLALTLCVACGKKEEKIEPFKLDEMVTFEEKTDEDTNELVTTTIEKDELQQLIDDKKSFGVYVFLPGCSSCAEFREVLKEYQKDHNINYYSTQIKYAKETVIGEKIKYAPSFVIFKEGKIVAYLDAESDDDLPYYKTTDKLHEWLTKYIIME